MQTPQVMDSPIAWVVLAIALFWSVGAYNRLVRLRSHVMDAFVLLDAHLAHYIKLVAAYLQAASGLALAQAAVAHAHGRAATALAGLQGASAQFEASLKVARRNVLDASAVAALQTAHATLQVSWTRAQQEYANDLDLLPRSGEPSWEENARQAAHATADFNRAVLAHNEAVAQFPALLLARLFGFKAAGCL